MILDTKKKSYQNQSIYTMINSNFYSRHLSQYKEISKATLLIWVYKKIKEKKLQ
jgi:hypothetical protein